MRPTEKNGEKRMQSFNKLLIVSREAAHYAELLGRYALPPFAGMTMFL